jgi:PAS domain S-box-containing protein
MVAAALQHADSYGQMDAQREPTGHRDWRHLLGPAVEALREGVTLHDLAGACRASNPSARTILGVTQEQLESEILDVHAEHADGTRMAYEDQPLVVTLRTGEVQQDVRIGFHRPDGMFVLLSLTSVPLIEDGDLYGAIVTFEDITALVAAQDVLARTQDEASEIANRLRTIVDHLPDAMVVVVDPDLRVVTAGGPTLGRNGYAADELTGLLLPDFLPPDRFASLEPRFRAALAGREQSFEWRAVRTAVDTLIDLVPLTSDTGAITGVMVVMRDVTERARLDRERFEAESVFRATFEGAPIGLCMIGAQGEQRDCFMRVNPAMAEMLGVPAEELAGRRSRGDAA